MKKIIMLLLICLSFLTGCSKNKTNDVSDVTKYLDSLDSYSLTSTMTINKNNRKIEMDVCVDYQAPNNYKVVFGKDNEQLILKNDKGVFIITPNLNKEFKFDGSWPSNSSHAYLLDAISNDLKKDETSSITNNENEIVLEGKVNHKTNQRITKMKYICDKKYKPIKTIFLDDENNEIIVVKFNNFSENPKYSKDYFNEKTYLRKDIVNEEEPETSISIETSNVLEGSVLQSSITNPDSTILCYSGEKSYTIVINKVKIYPEVVLMEKYDDIVVLECGLGLIKENSFTYFLNGYEINIYSTSLTPDDYENISSDLILI